MSTNEPATQHNGAVPNILLTVPEACETLRISRGTLYGLINKGKIPVVKMGPGKPSCVRFRPADLQDFVDAHLVVRAEDE